MAKSNLTKLLANIIAEVERSSSDYRNFKSNRLIHGISINSQDVAKEVESEFKALLETDALDSTLKSAIQAESEKFTAKMYNAFKTTKEFDPTGRRNVEVVNWEGNSSNFSFSLVTKKGKKPTSIFNAFKRVKQAQQKDFNANLAKLLKQSSSGAYDKYNSTKQGKGFLDIGHVGGSSVSAQRLAAVYGAITKFSSPTGDGGAARRNLAAEVQQALDSEKWSIQKSDKGPPIDHVYVKMESKQINRDNKDEVLHLNKTITSIIEKIGKKFAEVPGSDSSITKRQKIILKQFESKLKGKKGIKLTGFDTRTVQSHKGETSKTPSKTGKVLTGASLASKSSKRSARQKPKNRGVSSSPLALLVLINKDLSNTVADNMVGSRLNYQSGRFAESVRATDVITTARGFPSVGYTYDKFPYQTFEPGYAQGDVNRDPRRLIDKSIREIATQFAVGRFYTRRM